VHRRSVRRADALRQLIQSTTESETRRCLGPPRFAFSCGRGVRAGFSTFSGRPGRRERTEGAHFQGSAALQRCRMPPPPWQTLPPRCRRPPPRWQTLACTLRDASDSVTEATCTVRDASTTVADPSLHAAGCLGLGGRGFLHGEGCLCHGGRPFAARCGMPRTWCQRLPADASDLVAEASGGAGMRACAGFRAETSQHMGCQSRFSDT
jgi:hypothetical protein